MVDNHQANHQGTVVEVLCLLQGTPISILLDFGTSNSFISPSVVKYCNLVVAKQGIKWHVELAFGEKVLVESLLPGCKLEFGSVVTSVNLHILPLGSYDVILGMDWLSAHQAIIDFRHKSIHCQDDSRGEVEIVGIQKPISLRIISTM